MAASACTQRRNSLQRPAAVGGTAPMRFRTRCCEKVCSRRNAVTLVDLGATMSLMKSATPTLALPYL
jgi:hypothetical protein